MTKEAASSREYEKGVDRWKHVGTTDHPEIVHHNGIPKYAIGKCPRNVPDATKAELLQEAVPANNGDREIDYPKRLLVVHEGAVYRAETTTAGKSYHAYATTNSVGRPDVQAFVGSLVGLGATKGVFVTTSSFSAQAKDFVRHLAQRVILIDGQRLADLMIEHNVGVRIARTVEFKRIDEDFFSEEE